MLESGLSGSVRGVPSNGHPYRDPGSEAAFGGQHRLDLVRAPKRTFSGSGLRLAPEHKRAISTG